MPCSHVERTEVPNDRAVGAGQLDDHLCVIVIDLGEHRSKLSDRHHRGESNHSGRCLTRGATMRGVLWSTHRQGDPRSIEHLMQPDGHGRPTSPVCGLSTEGLWFRRDH